MRMTLIAIAVIAVVATPANAEVLTWDCGFQTRSDLDGITKEDFDLIFKVDTTTKKAYIEGNNGVSELEMHVGDGAFSFMERVSSGTVQTTTITPNGLAVHSRNTVIEGQFVAAQYHGTCRFE